jgi:hypothetical protein
MATAGAAAERENVCEKHKEKAAQLLTAIGEFHDDFSVLVMPYVRMTKKLR